MPKVSQLRAIFNFFILTLEYVKANKALAFLCFYVLTGTGLKIFTQVNILPPCVWKTFFHIECPGCGLTTALIYLVQGDFTDAYYSNPLIYIIIPAVAGFIAWDYLRFIFLKKDT